MQTKSTGGNEYLLIQSPDNYHHPNKDQNSQISWRVFGR